MFSASIDMIPENLKTGSVCLSDDSFLSFIGSASTPVENFAIIGYFEEIRDIIRKKHVHLASLQGPFFWVRGISGSQRLHEHYCLIPERIV